MTKDPNSMKPGMPIAPPTMASEEEFTPKVRELFLRLEKVRWPMAPDETDEPSPN
jgi:hypothetical protein